MDVNGPCIINALLGFNQVQITFYQTGLKSISHQNYSMRKHFDKISLMYHCFDKTLGLLLRVRENVQLQVGLQKSPLSVFYTIAVQCKVTRG